MARRYLFADESGNFDFSPKGSRYFVLTTITLDSYAVGDALLALRRDMAWRGIHLPSGFHATEDRQAVRDEVFALLRGHDFRIDATILEKRKAMPHVRVDDETFYLHAWYYHLTHIARRIVREQDELLVVGASWGTRRKQQAVTTALASVVGRTTRGATAPVQTWDCASEPCLQAADYCCWALSRTWESGDRRSYDLIRPKIATEFDLFGQQRRVYY